jgi:hypothetical protein
MRVKVRHKSLLAFITGIAPVLALPLYFWAYIGAGLSVSAPHATIGSLLLLSIGPVVALVALLCFLRFGKVTVLKVVMLLIPALLSLAELVFVFLLWKSG